MRRPLSLPQRQWPVSPCSLAVSPLFSSERFCRPYTTLGRSPPTVSAVSLLLFYTLSIPPVSSLLHSPPSYPARTAFSPTSTSSRCFRSLLSLSLSFSLSPSRSPPRSHGLNPALELVNSPTLAPWSILALAPPFSLCNAHLPAQARHSQASAALMDLYEPTLCAATGSYFTCKILTFNDRP